MRIATPEDFAVLETLMRAFYVEEKLTFNDAVAEALQSVLGEPSLGQILYDKRGAYLAMVYGFSFELGGRTAFVDELFVEPAARRQNVARTLMNEAARLAKLQGLVALMLEIAEPEPHKVAFYTSCGFARRAHPLMIKLLVE